jgi:protein TonB
MESLIEAQGTSRTRGILVGLGALGAAAAMVLAISGLLSSAGAPRRRPVEVALVRETPPVEKPPEKPPEPELKRDEIQLPEPQPPRVEERPEPPVTDRVGLDTDAMGGADAYELDARRGGRDITLGGTAGAGPGSFDARWYASVLQEHFNKELNKDRRLRETVYKADLHVWLTDTGSVERVELGRGTGDAKVDELLQQALATMPPLSRRPPVDMAQPIRLRITSRGAS